MVFNNVNQAGRALAGAVGLVAAGMYLLAQGTQSPIPRTFFGLHINNLALPNASGGTLPYPPANFIFSGLRLHDAAVTWAALETSRGVYAWTRLDDYVQLAQQNGFDLMLTVDDTPEWASSAPSRTNCQYSQFGSGGCAMPANMQDYVDFIKAVASRYKGKIQFYEGWNEANTGWVAPGARTTYKGAPYFIGTQNDLVRLQQMLYQTVKSADPAAQVVSPSFVDKDQGITDVNTLLAAGACKYFDIMGFHYYTQGAPPETIVQLAQGTNNALSSNNCGNKPMWDTETGWSAPNPFPDFSAPGVLARSYLMAWSAGIQRFYWYAYNNQGFDVFFLNNPLNYLNGAAYAYQNLQSWLIGATLNGCSQNSGGIYMCNLTAGTGELEWVVWYATSATANNDTQVLFQVPANWNATVAHDINGNQLPASGNVWVGPSPVLFNTRTPTAGVATHVSAASYNGTSISAGSLVTAFGSNLAGSTAQATTLSGSLAGTSVSITDAAGATFAGSPIYVSPQQVNYYLPEGLAQGSARITITNASGASTSSTVTIAPVTPGLFTEGQLQGPPAAFVLHYANGVQQSYDFAFDCTSASSCAPKPITLSQAGDTVYLELFATGLRHSSQSVSVQIGGTNYPAAFAGAQSQFAGLDQVNVLLPASLAGSGILPVAVIVDTQISNTVQIDIR